jgi:hypothetical protein
MARKEKVFEAETPGERRAQCMKCPICPDFPIRRAQQNKTKQNTDETS